MVAGRGWALVVHLHEADPVLALAQVQVKLQLGIPHTRVGQSLLAPAAHICDPQPRICWLFVVANL